VPRARRYKLKHFLIVDNAQLLEVRCCACRIVIIRIVGYAGYGSRRIADVPYLTSNGASLRASDEESIPGCIPFNSLNNKPCSVTDPASLSGSNIDRMHFEVVPPFPTPKGRSNDIASGRPGRDALIPFMAMTLGQHSLFGAVSICDNQGEISGSGRNSSKCDPLSIGRKCDCRIDIREDSGGSSTEHRQTIQGTHIFLKGVVRTVKKVSIGRKS